MQVNTNINKTDLYTKYEEVKIQKKEEVKSSYSDLRSQLQKNSMGFSSLSMDAQAKVSGSAKGQMDLNQKDFQSFLKDIGYNGKNIADLSQSEAKKLVADDGFFGVTKTAQRIADFVINGAGDNEGMLRAGRSGIMQGFNDAQKAWGDKLPDISQQTITKATDLINQKMTDLGYSVLDTNA